MLLRPGIRPAYSRAERFSDGVVHVMGVALALISVPLLIGFTVAGGDARMVWATGIYGATLVAMLTFSALYNMIDSIRWKGLLKRFDHSGIYFKIAGTYTPFVLTTGAQPSTLLAGLWGTAAFGAFMKFVAPNRYRLLAVALYLCMGWAVMVADRGLLAELSGPVLTLMLAGGIVYTFGVVFYLFDRLPFHYTIWHVFVLVGTGLFFAAVSVHTLGGLV
ncbi:Hly-III family protein [Oceanicola sp. 22II-s10i]|uniref:PAQR family membrane homeostasis protein TrhA n=1 Tax=Oceanicola sp. 22II-s10i TaxID=1317116 RepID=UPI000B5211A4|nr:hemolysin III family protein [Oceanicola sp. 22II-s10i]OWU84301.1 Hly-III family protein [Oceanicola sp. 22II-s10i]